MRMDKLTARLQQALSDAQSLAVGQGNSTIEPVHLMLALMQQQGGAARPLLENRCQQWRCDHRLEYGRGQAADGG